MSEDRADRPNGRNILVLISESDELPRHVRSDTREVRYWSAAGGNGAGTRFTGDPTDAATYEWSRQATTVSAVIDLHPPDRARAALEALRAVRPDAAALLLSQQSAEVAGPNDGTLARRGRLRDVLRLDIDEELSRLEAERRAHCLRQFAAGEDVVPILIHNEPDPDALSSALAVATLLGGGRERTPIVTLEEMTRPENRRMAELLHIRVTRVTREELRGFDRVITVDTQPRGLQQEGSPRLAVIDHHPREHDYSAEFADIRPEYGATATIMTEYLRATDAARVHRGLATALLYGIKTDTDSLVRGVTPADVAAYAYLQQHADLTLVRRFERPTYALDTARAFGTALCAARCEGDLCVAYLGERDATEAHVLADLADFCLGIENVTWVCVAALLDGEIDLTLRHVGTGAGAGGLARTIVQRCGGGASGGGHATMARVSIPAEAAAGLLAAEPAAAVGAMVRDAIDAMEAEPAV